ncbi:MAG: hypothetical protein RMY34_17490 [Aulosira sp. DedQUE10]|nr:hypothetical protein [Aulosira sp. DedQUE10]
MSKALRQRKRRTDRVAISNLFEINTPANIAYYLLTLQIVQIGYFSLITAKYVVIAYEKLAFC